MEHCLSTHRMMLNSNRIWLASPQLLSIEFPVCYALEIHPIYILDEFIFTVFTRVPKRHEKQLLHLASSET